MKEMLKPGDPGALCEGAWWTEWRDLGETGTGTESEVKGSGEASLESSSGVTKPDIPTCEGEAGALLKK